MTEILLATFNGERFLPEQIESIINQSYTDYKILASDDNSSDCTFEILRSYESVLKEKIKVIQSDTHSAKENFYNLLDRADAEYIALCDQDDFWETDKLKKSIKAIKILEKNYGKDTPEHSGQENVRYHRYKTDIKACRQRVGKSLYNKHQTRLFKIFGGK